MVSFGSGDHLGEDSGAPSPRAHGRLTVLCLGQPGRKCGAGGPGGPGGLQGTNMATLALRTRGRVGFG